MPRPRHIITDLSQLAGTTLSTSRLEHADGVLWRNGRFPRTEWEYHAYGAILKETLAQGRVVELAADGSRRAHATAPGQVLLPGAFNPVHDGHWKLAEAGRAVLGRD